MGKKVLIIGAGFGGVYAAKGLQDTEFEVTIVDKTNHHLFQPLLYQVATAALSPGDIATPIRSIFSEKRNIKVLLGEIISINKEEKYALTNNEEKIFYDYLIIATGARHSYFGKDEWEKYAPGLKTLNDALTIRERIISSFEIAEKLNDFPMSQKYLTFAIIGGGPTGVEVAGAIAEITQRIIEKDYRNLRPDMIKIYLVEAMSKILAMFPEDLSVSAMDDLKHLGVEILLNKPVSEINDSGIKVGDEFIETENVIWAAGNIASPLLKTLNTKLDKQGRAIVNDKLNIPGHPEIFIIGDASAFKDEEGRFLPALAPVALQQGKYVAKIIQEHLSPENRVAFRYSDRGSMATIGRNKAVAIIKGIKLKGFFAWLSWSVIHVMFLIAFRNRFRVMLEWIWYYITFRHGVRLIVGRSKANYLG